MPRRWTGERLATHCPGRGQSVGMHRRGPLRAPGSPIRLASCWQGSGDKTAEQATLDAFRQDEVGERSASQKDKVRWGQRDKAEERRQVCIIPSRPIRADDLNRTVRPRGNRCRHAAE